MSVVWNTTMTNLGLQLQTKQVQGATIAFTRAVSGSGSVPVVNLREQTAVSQIQQTLSMQGLTMGDLQYTIKLLLTNLNLNSGYNLSQVGLYATDPDLGEILFAIAQLSDTKPIPSKTDAPGYSLLMSLTFQNDQGANIEITPDMSGYVSMSAAQDMIDDATDPIIESLDDKVEKVEGKGLSTNDFTNEDKSNLDANTSARHTHSNKSVLDGTTASFTSEEKNKLANIQASAEVNVQADWSQNDSTKDDYVKNKPTLGTAAAKNSTNAVTDDSTDLVESGAVFDNIQDVYEVMGKNGAKNYLFTSLEKIKEVNTQGIWNGNNYTINGVTFTILTDSNNNILGITANGTATSNAQIAASDYVPLKEDNYIMSASPIDGGTSTYQMFIAKNTNGTITSAGTDIGNGVQIEADGVSSYKLWLEVRTNYNANNLIFYPMIRLASDTDPTFQPYAKTNLQLTKEVEGTKTTTGNPITLTNAAPVNAANLSMDLEPIQDLHGYDHPWVGGAGKNKLVYPYANTTETQNNVTFTDEGNGVVDISINGISSARTIFYIHKREDNFRPPIGTYKFTKSFTNANIGVVIECYNGTTYVKNLAKSYSPDEVTFSVDYNGYDTIAMYIEVRNGVSANPIKAKPMIRLATETDSSFAPYSNICPISGRSEVAIQRVGKNLAKEIINGYVDSTARKFYTDAGETILFYAIKGQTYKVSSNKTINRGAVALINTTNIYNNMPVDDLIYIGNNTTSWTATWSGWSLWYITNETWSETETNTQLELGSTATTFEPYAGKTYTIQIGQTVYGGTLDVTRGKMVVDKGYVDLGDYDWATQTIDGNDCFRTNLQNKTYTRDAICSQYSFAVRCGTDYSFCTDLGVPTNFFVRDSRYSGTTAFKQAMSGVQLVYELAEPYTIQLTPQQIKMLENTNTVYTDYEGDTIHIEYQPNNAIGEAVREAALYTDSRTVAIPIYGAAPGEWTAGGGPAWLRNVAYGNGVFVTAGESGKTYYSTDGGITWTAGSGLPTNANFNGIAYGNGVFVAAGTGAIYYSIDEGKTWTAGTGVPAVVFYGIAYGNGIFVAVGSSGNIYYSTDEGKTWTAGTGLTGLFYGIAYGNGVFVAVGAVAIYYSTDGITWTESSNISGCHSVAYGRGVFVTTEAAGTNAYYSTDGITWTAASGTIGYNASKLTYGNGIFVLAGSSVSEMSYSTDGKTWTGEIQGFDVYGLAYGNGVFVAVGGDDGNFYANVPIQRKTFPELSETIEQLTDSIEWLKPLGYKTSANPVSNLYFEKSGNVINIEARDVDGSAFTTYPGAGGYTLPTGYRPKRMLIVCVYVYTTYDNKNHHGIIKIRDDGTMDGYFIDFSGNEHKIYDSSYSSSVSFNTSYIV